MLRVYWVYAPSCEKNSPATRHWKRLCKSWRAKLSTAWVVSAAAKPKGHVTGYQWTHNFLKRTIHVWRLLCWPFPLIFPYNVKWGLINPPINHHHCPPKKCNLKTGGPPGLINRLAGTWLINLLCWNPLFYPTIFISNSIYFQLFFTFFYHHCYT